jgi:hypothetical protein
VGKTARLSDSGELLVCRKIPALSSAMICLLKNARFWGRVFSSRHPDDVLTVWSTLKPKIERSLCIFNQR